MTRLAIPSRVWVSATHVPETRPTCTVEAEDYGDCYPAVRPDGGIVPAWTTVWRIGGDVVCNQIPEDNAPDIAERRFASDMAFLEYTRGLVFEEIVW